MKNKLLAYAMDFASFLMERIDVPDVKRVILFGSVAREEASPDSDIDLFIDVAKGEKSITSSVRAAQHEFLKSARYKNYWQLKDVKNEIKPIIGRLDEWKELKDSIIANGITLYGKFEELPKKTISKTLFAWENIKPESKRVLLSKRLFGYAKGKKTYDGLLQKYNGERMGKGMLLAPSEHALVFLRLFRSMGITVKIKNVFEHA